MDATQQHCDIRGVLPTVLTAYDEDERVDPDGLRAQVSYLLDAGVHGLTLMGSFGEAPYLSEADRELVIRTVVEAADGRVPILVGITAESTFVATEQLDQAHRLGATAVMVCLPQYFRIEFDDVKRHYERLAGLGLLPVFYYHYPAASRLELKPARIAELLAIPGVVGIKETTFDMLAVRQHIALARGIGRVFLSGSELNFVEFMDLGGHGTVSASSAVMPRTAVAMYEAYQAGNRPRAAELQAQLFQTMPLLKDTSAPIGLTRLAFMRALRQGLEVSLGIDSTQARIKAALRRRGLPIRPVVRGPLRQLTHRDEQVVARVMEKIEAIEPSPTNLEAGKLRVEAAERTREAHWPRVVEPAGKTSVK